MQYDWCPCKEIRTQTGAEGRPRGDTERRQPVCAPRGPSEGASPADTWTSDFWLLDCERMSLSSRPLRLKYFVLEFQLGFRHYSELENVCLDSQGHQNLGSQLNVYRKSLFTRLFTPFAKCVLLICTRPFLSA